MTLKSGLEVVQDIVDFSSLTAFKRTIKSVDFNAFLNVLKCK